MGCCRAAYGQIRIIVLVSNNPVSSFVAGSGPSDMEAILRRADPTFEAAMSNDDRLAKVFRSAAGFQVDILTKYGRGRRSPVVIDRLVCSAEALKFMEFSCGESVEAVALYGAGVLVSVPPPARYAVHKLLIAQERRANPVKRNKDLMQARDLIEVFREIGSDALDEALDEALDDAGRRGPSWRKIIGASLREIGRQAQQGRPPVPVR